MPKIVEAIVEITRLPEEVFDYVCDASRLPEWQPDVEAAEAEPPGIPAVGMRGREIRKVPGGSHTIRWEVTDCQRARIWAVRGVEGPVRAHVTMTFSPNSDGTSSTCSYRIWFEGHGIGKAIAIIAPPRSRQGQRRKPGPAQAATRGTRIRARPCRRSGVRRQRTIPQSAIRGAVTRHSGWEGAPFGCETVGVRVLCSTTAGDGHFGPLKVLGQACAAGATRS